MALKYSAVFAPEQNFFQSQLCIIKVKQKSYNLLEMLLKNTLEIQKLSLLSAVPEGVNKNLVVFDCDWTYSAAQFKSTLNIAMKRIRNYNIRGRIHKQLRFFKIPS